MNQWRVWHKPSFGQYLSLGLYLWLACVCPIWCIIHCWLYTPTFEQASPEAYAQAHFVCLLASAPDPDLPLVDPAIPQMGQTLAPLSAVFIFVMVQLALLVHALERRITPVLPHPLMYQWHHQQLKPPPKPRFIVSL